MKFKILTYNIHKGFNLENRFTLDKIKIEIKKLNPDFIFLQEIIGQNKKHESNIEKWPIEPQLEFIADKLWPHYAYGKNAIYDKGHHGNAILSKFPFAFWENINVSKIIFASRSLLHGVIEIPSIQKKLHMICVHLGISEFERNRHIQIMIQRIKSHVPENEPLIVAGDFNDWLKRASYFAKELNLTEANMNTNGHYAKTFPSIYPFLCLDRIYVRGLKINSCTTIKEWKHLSDHLPLVSELEF